MTKNHDIDLVLKKLSGVNESDVIDRGYSKSYRGLDYIIHNVDDKSILFDATLSYQEIIELAEALKGMDEESKC